MTKLQFVLELRDKLSGIPKEDMEERLTFYAEMIEDRMEEGLSEDKAVEDVGSVDEIAAQITAENLCEKPENEVLKIKSKLKTWEILLLILGSPIWFSLLVAVLAVAVSIYVSWWSVIIALWSTFIAFCASALGVFVGLFAIIFGGYNLAWIAFMGIGIFCAGAAIFLFFGYKSVTKLTLKYTKKSIVYIKKVLQKGRKCNE